MIPIPVGSKSPNIQSNEDPRIASQRHRAKYPRLRIELVMEKGSIPGLNLINWSIDAGGARVEV